MGSIGFTIPTGSTARHEVKKYLDKNCGGEILVHNYGPGAGEWGGALYAAVRMPGGPDFPANQVIAVIALFSQASGQVFIKLMDETCGPTYRDAGTAVMKALTPLPQSHADSYAARWRESVAEAQRQRAAAKGAIGKTITLATPLSFGGGTQVDRVRVQSLTRWVTPSGDHLRPPSQWWVTCQWALAH